MGLGAIVVIGGEREALCSTRPLGQQEFLSEPLPCVEILGRSMIERTIERFRRADVELITVLVVADEASGDQAFSLKIDNAKVLVVPEACSAIRETLERYSDAGIQHSFVTWASVYAETDLLDLFYFHREARQAATRAGDRDGLLELWVVDCARAQEYPLEDLLAQADGNGVSYFIREYVIRLAFPGDLRRFASDVLRGGCSTHPPGLEVKRGIWVDEGAEVHRRARVVAPAYIGRGSKVMQDTLITRCSTIEKGCCIDCGTVVEGSSILAYTHIGIWLDVCKAVASGNKLLSLGRDVVVEISDPSVMRLNGSARKQSMTSFILGRRAKRETKQEEQKTAVADVQPHEAPASESWQLGTNLIQG